jgi:hypothetical protein
MGEGGFTAGKSYVLKQSDKYASMFKSSIFPKRIALYPRSRPISQSLPYALDINGYGFLE